MSSDKSSSRYFFVDAVRFLAIILMVFFHASYDLTALGFLKIDFLRDQFWFLLPRFIVLCFLLCVGMSMQIGYRGQIQWAAVKKRFFKIFGFALGVSLTTYIMFPSSWIYFGTLHCIAFSSLLALPFLGRPRIALLLGLTLLGLRFGLGVKFNLLPMFSHIKSVDYIPLYPWFSVVCIGLFLPSIGAHKWGQQWDNRVIKWASKRSLWIYLLHQPIIFGSLVIYKKFLYTQ